MRGCVSVIWLSVRLVHHFAKRCVQALSRELAMWQVYFRQGFLRIPPGTSL